MLGSSTFTVVSVILQTDSNRAECLLSLKIQCTLSVDEVDNDLACLQGYSTEKEGLSVVAQQNFNNRTKAHVVKCFGCSFGKQITSS